MTFCRVETYLISEIYLCICSLSQEQVTGLSWVQYKLVKKRLERWSIF